MRTIGALIHLFVQQTTAWVTFVPSTLVDAAFLRVLPSVGTQRTVLPQSDQTAER